ncbi:hypothetical protein OU748_003619 [Yersinia enterocolitica]|uniref:hypothetical protein n=1 Tax=Yersinia TaxID=629 RepID=UPI0005DFA4F3|nr:MULTISPECIES: hypothetical protein [Yersinia]EKN3755922.1 hypothetical protein [Yersinia enterocolitica]EKN3797253.1 hypothetical protein [Yersinia enterocolitica]EKN3878055.1 hypothetical protein [Yersinia enterocolitica]EKN4175567.1 hypothetical protein [Yersinia enterocolitica]ELY5229064.1 hypothetical protein [Yersinia enterocolitica]
MKVSYDLVIKSGDQDVDMEYGVDTLGGTSEVTCILAEAILRKKIIKRRTHVNPARAVLKQSFKSSYGQNFDLVVNEPELVAELKKMGRSVFSEVMGYFISESLYLETKEVSPKAASFINGLAEIEDELIERIRRPLLRMHRINLQRNFDIEFNYKKPISKETVINLNTRTATNLTQSKIIKQKVEISAVITRFNSRTGNGRLVLEGEDDTVAFGFYMPLKSIQTAQKRKISLNLHNNNTREDNYSYISMVVSRVVILSGETVKYLIHSVE